MSSPFFTGKKSHSLAEYGYPAGKYTQPPAGFRFDLRLSAKLNYDEYGNPPLIRVGPGSQPTEALDVDSFEPSSVMEEPVLFYTPATAITSRSKFSTRKLKVKSKVKLKQKGPSSRSTRTAPPSLALSKWTKPVQLSARREVTHETLWVKGIPPCGVEPHVVDRTPYNPDHKCGICLDLLSHPVLAGTTSVMFASGFISKPSIAARSAMEISRCPPLQQDDFEKILAATYPAQLDQSTVVWEDCWRGLWFTPPHSHCIPPEPNSPKSPIEDFIQNYYILTKLVLTATNSHPGFDRASFTSNHVNPPNPKLNFPDNIRDTLISRYEYVVAEKEVIPDLTDVLRLCDTCQVWCRSGEALPWLWLDMCTLLLDQYYRTVNERCPRCVLLPNKTYARWFYETIRLRMKEMSDAAVVTLPSITTVPRCQRKYLTSTLCLDYVNGTTTRTALQTRKGISGWEKENVHGDSPDVAAAHTRMHRSHTGACGRAIRSTRRQSQRIPAARVRALREKFMRRGLGERRESGGLVLGGKTKAADSGERRDGNRTNPHTTGVARRRPHWTCADERTGRRWGMGRRWDAAEHWGWRSCAGAARALEVVPLPGAWRLRRLAAGVDARRLAAGVDPAHLGASCREYGLREKEVSRRQSKMKRRRTCCRVTRVPAACLRWERVQSPCGAPGVLTDEIAAGSPPVLRRQRPAAGIGLQRVACRDIPVAAGLDL
ncbi:hypothetical protein C8R43DRAFT_960426 [Mycena crocata]|nr:hypothetical protein C8R43DRAFT_960426 [Mycena crocata]